MYKDHLRNAIVKEMQICKRLYTKIPEDKMDFRPKENVRSILELLQYLSFIGTAMPDYWLNYSDVAFGDVFGKLVAGAKEMQYHAFPSAMDSQMEKIELILNQLSEKDLSEKQVTYPWGGEVAMGEGIMATSVKYLAAYKLQLFSLIKFCSDQKLGTADAWILTEIG